jgi:hypothetical protein
MNAQPLALEPYALAPRATHRSELGVSEPAEELVQALGPLPHLLEPGPEGLEAVLEPAESRASWHGHGTNGIPRSIREVNDR